VFGEDHCSTCGWTVQNDLDSIREYTEQVFPSGVDSKAAAARMANAQLKRMLNAAGIAVPEDWLHTPDGPPLPVGVPGMGCWVLVAREKCNGVYFETQVMQVGSRGCIVRTLTDGINHGGGPAHGSSMVFVPGASVSDFHVHEDLRQQEQE